MLSRGSIPGLMSDLWVGIRLSLIWFDVYGVALSWVATHSEALNLLALICWLTDLCACLSTDLLYF